MATVEPTLILKLQKLPPQRLAEVADLVEFLAAREARGEAGARLGESLERLDALNLPPLSDDEIAAEIQVARQERTVRSTWWCGSYQTPNAVISALLSAHGPPRRLHAAARAPVFELCSSPVLVAELLDVVSREKFSKRLAAAGLTPFGVVGDIRLLAVMAAPADVPRVVTDDPDDDPDDDHVLACALTAQADLIVSGDKHLLGLGGQYQGIAIVTPAQATLLVGR